jgi:DNA-binding transcriptional LysR family regulator
MPRDIDAALMRAFLAVNESGGMTSAARVLNLTQAAVSQQIKRLEELFAVTLFDRQAKQLQLTPEGLRLLGHARRLVHLNDEVVGIMTSQEVSGEIRLGVPHDIVSVYLPPILRRYAQIRPNIRVVMIASTSRKLISQLEAGEVDLTLTTELAPVRGHNLLSRQNLLWVGAENGQVYRRRPLPLSTGDDTCAFMAVAVPVLRDAGIDWVKICEARYTPAVIATVEADLSVGLTVLGPETGLPTLPDFYVNLRLPVGGGNQSVKELAGHIREHFAQRYRRAA